LLTMRFGAGASAWSIAQELGIAPSTVREYLSRAAGAGIIWPLAADVTDESLMARLFVNAGVRAGARYHAEPDWAALVREFKRPGVNLLVLWEEYRAIHPQGYAYSRYVAARLMWRRGEKDWFPWHKPQHNFDDGASDYRPFRNVISDGSGRCQGFVCRSEISTRASAFAFISMSTSA